MENNPLLSSPAWDDHRECEGWFWLSSGGRVALCLDIKGADYHMSASDDAGTQEVLEALDRVRGVGFQLCELDYCEPVVLPSGNVQLSLVCFAADRAYAYVQQNRKEPA